MRKPKAPSYDGAYKEQFPEGTKVYVPNEQGELVPGKVVNSLSEPWQTDSFGDRTERVYVEGAVVDDSKDDYDGGTANNRSNQAIGDWTSQPQVRSFDCAEVIRVAPAVDESPLGRPQRRQ